jgi:hypothetical protein
LHTVTSQVPAHHIHLPLLEKIRLDLLAVMKWMAKNGISLRVSKTQLIVVGNGSDVNRVVQVNVFDE